MTNKMNKQNTSVISIVAFNKIKMLVDDLVNKPLTEYGTKVLLDDLHKCVDEHNNEVNSLLKLIDTLTIKANELNVRITQPQEREKEFIDIAKKLNFPIVNAVSDNGAINPNIVEPVNDPSLIEDIDKVKPLFEDTSINDVILPKEEQLTDTEVECYKDFNSMHGTKLSVDLSYDKTGTFGNIHQIQMTKENTLPSLKENVLSSKKVHRSKKPKKAKKDISK